MLDASATVADAARFYAGLGIDTLPLRPGSKSPIADGWPCNDPKEMWKNAPPDANIAIRCDGPSALVVIDCDEKKKAGTFKNVTDYIHGLGVSNYPIVQTASRIGRHIYLSANGHRSGHWRKLDGAVGEGELRYGSAAYVVAEPSKINDGGSYRLVKGDFRRLPILSFSDLLGLIPTNTTGETTQKNRKGIPRRVKALLQGKYLENYASRSEAAQSILVSLVNVGLTFDQVLSLFRSYPATGKFRERYDSDPNDAIRWLYLSFANAERYAYANISEGRERAIGLRLWALKRPWPARGGSSDRAVFLALLKIAARAGRLSIAASSRDVAELAGIGRRTASRALVRLEKKGLIKLVQQAVGPLANRYQIIDVNSGPLPHIRDVWEWATNLDVSHDVFRHGALYKSAAEVWAELQKAPTTEEELAQKTGRHIQTIRAALDRMTGIVDLDSGELVDMVYFDGERWHAEDVDLDRIAELLGVVGKGERQRRKHLRERKNFRRFLEREE